MQRLIGGSLLNPFNLIQRDKEISMVDNKELFLLQQVIKGAYPVLLYINKPKETAFAMVMLPVKRETPIIAIVSSGCDTIAITLPIMTPCITSNLVFRILSPWKGGLEGVEGRGGHGTEVCRGWERAQEHQCRPTFSQ